MDKKELPSDEELVAYVREDFGTKDATEVFISLGVKIRKLELMFEELDNSLRKVKSYMDDFDFELDESDDA